MGKKYLLLSEMGVFQPMPVPQSLEDKIRSDSDTAKALFMQTQQEHKQQTAQEAS